MADTYELPQACRVDCHACGSAIPLASGESVGFRDECDPCGADLHVCLNCTHHDPSAYNECREPGTERVSDRDRANRCDWFRPTDAPASSETGPADAARAALERLFSKD